MRRAHFPPVWVASLPKGLQRDSPSRLVGAVEQKGSSEMLSRFKDWQPADESVAQLPPRIASCSRVF